MIPFKLNMNILHDALSERYPGTVLQAPDEAAFLEDVRLFTPDQSLVSQHVYIIRGEEAHLLPPGMERLCFIVAGESDAPAIPGSCYVLRIRGEADVFRILACAQDVFEKYRNWNLQLHAVLDMDSPLEAMLQVSRDIFHNPIFVHDVGFNILAYSHRAPGMLVWEQDPRTGNHIVPLSLINDFKVEPAYLATLATTEPSLYPPEQRGYPILYMNIWRDGRYEGRICVDELETPILPGQYLAIGHLAKLIVRSLGNHSLMQFNLENSITEFFCSYLSGAVEDQTQIMKMLQLLNWKRYDSYLCLRLDARQQDIRMKSSAAALGHIELQVPNSHAFIYQEGISVIVNLTYSHSRISDVVSRLAILLRDGLMKMGTSTEIKDFLLIPQGHEQAVTALNLGLQSTSMRWCYRFDDYFLEFLHMKAAEVLPPQLLCPQKLIDLRNYDRANHTDLYNTLKIYLEMERNVLQTANKLFIHRSTLFYRLERIRKIADVDLDDAQERLILRLSFYFLALEEQENLSSGKAPDAADADEP